MQDDQHQDVQPVESIGDVLPSQPLRNVPGIPASSDDTLTHQLLTWPGLPTAREQRRYLESHCDLLDLYSENILQALLAQEQAQQEEMQRVRDAMVLLQDARTRAGTEEAIREAYINAYGGFVLDLPAWLEEVEQRLTNLLNAGQRRQTAEARVVLLQEALERALRDAALAPELLAILRRELASAWWEHPRTSRAPAYETAISACEEALSIYTAVHYPLQYAQTQKIRGNAYRDRIVGERRTNVEQAITCYHEALDILTLDAYPYHYAEAQTDLGIAYLNRIAGERRENLEQAIACYREALCVWTLDAYPDEYAGVQNNLGLAHLDRLVGERRENLEQAIACFHAALGVFTYDADPENYGTIQNSLGGVYRRRIAGERQENLERAIACHQEALRVWTLDAYPLYYAEGQNDLGDAYRNRIAGEQQRNLEQAIACYHEALRVYTLEAFPGDTRTVQLSIAETEAQRGNWDAVRDAYSTALEAEDLLLILGAGITGRDAILKEGRDAAIRLGFALYSLGRVSEAAVTMERGRARGLAEAIAFDAADPSHIGDEERRARYTTARQILVAAQADLHAPLPSDADEDTQRRLDLARIAAYRQAKSAFDAVVEDIREAEDPVDFLNAPLGPTTILQAAERVGSGHALVYLAATPWGGVAIAACSANTQTGTPSHFAALDLPQLTDVLVSGLVETHLGDESSPIIGGFDVVQRGTPLELLHQWTGETLREQVRALQNACAAAGRKSTLAQAAQALIVVGDSELVRLIDTPLATLDKVEKNTLNVTLAHDLLQRELPGCLEALARVALCTLITWLQKEGITSLTLISCGSLAAFPLAAVSLTDGRTVGETMPTSVAPSARTLLSKAPASSLRAGIYALGNPYPTTSPLHWGEAEALTLATVGQVLGQPAGARVQHEATRAWLLDALQNGNVVNASCHGRFNAADFLRSHLELANKETLTFADMLSYQADLHGLRLLILSACQTAVLDLKGARDEVHSLAVAMQQAGAKAVLASLWAVDDKATYLLMVRFAQEWFPRMAQESPAAALARAQYWLRTATNAKLQIWQAMLDQLPWMPPLSKPELPEEVNQEQAVGTSRLIAVRGRGARYDVLGAQRRTQQEAGEQDPMHYPYADPYFWAGFQITGW